MNQNKNEFSENKNKNEFNENKNKNEFSENKNHIAVGTIFSLLLFQSYNSNQGNETEHVVHLIATERFAKTPISTLTNQNRSFVEFQYIPMQIE